MRELLPMVTERDGVPVTTSRAVAEQFEKRHDNVLRDIQQIIEQLNETEVRRKFNVLNFEGVRYSDAKGEERPMYLLTRDGFVLLAMGFNGARALAFKVSYINAFNNMEQLLKGGGLSSTALQDIEKRRNALDGAVEQGKKEVQDSVSSVFFKALQGALDSGGYYLKDKWKREHREATGQLLGVDDGSRTFIKADIAYRLYREEAGAATISSRQGLWAVLEQAGAIYPRATTKGGRRISCDRQTVTVVCIDGDKLKRRYEI